MKLEKLRAELKSAEANLAKINKARDDGLYDEAGYYEDARDQWEEIERLKALIEKTLKAK